MGKFNVADPQTGSQRTFEVDDDKRLRFVLDKRIAQEVNGAILGDQFQDYTFKITGGIDKQGFPMRQGILVPDRVRLLLRESKGYILQKDGDRKRRSVRGCIVSREIAVVNMTIFRRGKEPIPDVTDKVLPRRLGPKRANNIRKLFNLEKSDDVRQYVVRREVPSKKEGGKPPKIQRLITPERLQRKRRKAAQIRKQREHSKQQAAAYAALLAQRKSEKRAALMSKKSRASARASQRKSEKKV